MLGLPMQIISKLLQTPLPEIHKKSKQLFLNFHSVRTYKHLLPLCIQGIKFGNKNYGFNHCFSITIVFSISFNQLYQHNQMKKNQIDLKSKPFPQCKNKKEARMVCLNESCPTYAFFCLQCEDESCEKQHQHQDKNQKYIAMSFKQFIRRVLHPREPIEQLAKNINTYQETLERLRKDVNEFVDKELKNLKEIVEQANQLPPQVSEIIKKLQQNKYDGLTGTQMDHLWKNCGDTQSSKQTQLQTADFIRIKQEQLKAISEHFQNLNQMDINNVDQPNQKQVANQKSKK